VTSLAGRYDWLPGWVEQHLGLTLAVVTGPSADDVLVALGGNGFDRGTQTLDEALDPGEPVVRIATVGMSVVAVSHFSTVAADVDVLQRLTAPGGRAIGLGLTMTINALEVVRDGEFLAGWDVDMPDLVSWGSAPQLFDPDRRAAGIGDDGVRVAAACAAFVELTTGLVLTRDLLEGPLPGGSVPGL
jgi:hypothetical protein